MLEERRREKIKIFCLEVSPSLFNSGLQKLKMPAFAPQSGKL